MRVWLLLIGLFALSGCCLEGVVVDKYITGNIHHVSCQDPNSGSIIQEWHPCFSLLGISNITYDWSTGEVVKDVYDKSPNYPIDYKCNVGYRFLNMNWTIPKKYGIRYEVEWPTSMHIDYSNVSKVLFRNTTGPANDLATICSSNVLPENGIGIIEFECFLAPGDGIVRLGFDNLSCPTNIIGNGTNFTGFELIKSSSGNVWSVYRNGIKLESGNAFVTGSFAQGDKFQIKIGNGLQFFYQGSLVPIQSVLVPIFTHPSYLIKCTMSGYGIKLRNINASFACSNSSDYYALLTKELDGSCYTMTGSVNFVYKEKYLDNTLDYVIYDWQRNQVLTSSILPVTGNNVTGTNYHIISVGSLLPDDYYTLEVTDSKGEIYKMRFRYVKLLTADNIFTLSPTGTGTVKPTYNGPANVDPTIKVSINNPKAVSAVIDIQNGMDYE